MPSSFAYSTIDSGKRDITPVYMSICTPNPIHTVKKTTVGNNVFVSEKQSRDFQAEHSFSKAGKAWSAKYLNKIASTMLERMEGRKMITRKNPPHSICL